MGINIKSVQAYLIGLSLPLDSEESFLKNKLDRKTDTFYENFQKAEKCSKNVTIFSSNLKHIFAWKMLKFGFLYFFKSCR